ncbi:OmpA family protein [Vibrio sp. JPW-9-11-11]|uniref:OmpA family protein n=1 Tax=Vibrio sp. JPW-9-11-11 TaxID=1416532 RepID=UPI001592B2C8|nr:OmpA family protein [Vibrio sp. JPW-9-11-11]NVD06223.1 OmpA family protein [Vibrio sp. JPW-9-11-11]
MVDVCTYDKPMYLLGAYFQGEDTGLGREFSNWNTVSDLTSVDEVKNVRPLPFTPILIDALAQDSVTLPRFWGSDQYGRLCNLSYLSEAIEGESQVLLRHNSPITTIDINQSYEMLFPPTNLIGQLAQNSSSITEIKESVKSLYTKMNPALNKPRLFKPSKISVKQLAKPYTHEHGQSLTQEEENYNQWYAAILSSDVEFIEGFVVPSVNTISIVFSSDIYIGAEVSLVKYRSTLGSQQETSEIVLERGIVRQPTFDDENRGSQAYKNTLPSVTINLPSVIKPAKSVSSTEDNHIVLADGFYGLRVQFFVKDYLKANERLQNEVPEVIKSGRLQFERNKSSAVTGVADQDCYTYELNEKVTFKSISGYGKLAIVCGDMISLEECLFYQYPQALPSNYSELMTKTGKSVPLSGTGVNTLGLASAIKKNAESLGEGFLMGGNPFSENLKATMFSVAKGIWSDIEQQKLPDLMTSSVAFAFGFSAFKESRKELTKAIRFANKGLDFNQAAALAFRKSGMNISFIKRELDVIKASLITGTFSENSTRLARSWFNGSVMEKMNRAFPILESGSSLVDLYDLVQKENELEKKSLEAKEDFDAISHTYLQSISVIKAYQEWAQALDDAKNVINGSDGEEIAHIVEDSQGLAIHINFKFNEWQHGNEHGKLRTDIKQVCKNLSQLMLDNPSYKVSIEGHAGRIGSSDANDLVAANRAKTVTNAITSIDSSLEERVYTASYGNTQPLTADSTKSDMSQTGDSAPAALDRRVEVRLIIPNYQVVLPPSRSGMVELEKARQLKQALDVGLDDTQKAQVAAVLTTLSGFAMFTPLAPLAAGILYLKSGAELADCALSVLDELITEKAYSDFKGRYQNIDQLNQLGKIHIRVLQQYRDLKVTIERSEIKTRDEVESHLKNKETVQELQKRFLLRALALNGLVELLARISLWNPNVSKLQGLLEEYRVKDYIDVYVINDNWEAPLSSYNTMAQNWIQRVRDDKSGASAARAFAQSWKNEHSPQLSPLLKRARIQGEFNKGFPVQARLYQGDVDNGFSDFAKMFDNNVESVKSDDIGFSRLLVDSRGDGVSWKPFDEWLSLNKTNRITPFTRVKVQIVLSSNASKSKKKIFKTTLQYCCERSLWDFKGPSFEVLMAPRKADDLTLCGSNDKLKSYFDQHAIEEHLTCVEFEPTYWFGEYEIPGLKPLYSNYELQDFDKWKQSGEARSMQYYFTADGSTLSLAGTDERLTMFNYGVDDNNTYGKQCHLNSDGEVEVDGLPLVLYDGLANRQVVINEYDLLIEEFVKSASAKKSEGIVPYLKGDVSSFSAVSKGSGFEWFDDKAPKSSVLDWSNDKPVTIYVALLSEGGEKETYRRMMGESYQVPMRLSLSIEEQESMFSKDTTEGPSFFGTLLEVGEYTYKKEVPSPYAKVEIKEVNFTDTNTELASGLGSFVKEFQAKVNAEPNRYLDPFSDRRTLHIVKFELRYTSPTGRRVPTLRPFGPILDKKKAVFLPVHIAVSSLSQMGLAPDVGIYPLKQAQKLSVQGGQEYSTKGMPWMEIERDVSRMNDSAFLYWQKELANNSTKRKEWIEDWITKEPMNVSAPLPKTV